MHQPARGTKDHLPQDMIKRNRVMDVIRDTFEKWGFDPLQTPAFEEWSLLSKKGGEAIKDEIYYFRDKSKRELGLRFDLTVPLARVVSNHPEIQKPFRRYQISPVWRYDRPGSGRYREFWQADIDIVGAPVGEADALCIAVACDAMKRLGVEFSIRINSRKIVQAFLHAIGLKEKAVDVLRSIDKLEKIGDKAVAKEMNAKRIGQEKIRAILEFVKVRGIAEASRLVEKENMGKEGVAELESVFDFADAFGVSDKLRFDASLVRGLEYYTGPVFEINAGVGVSVGGGGRYDNLVEGIGGKNTPAVGVSFGVDRLLLAIDGKSEKTLTRVYIAPVSDSVVKDAISIARELVSLGVNTEFDVMRRSLSKELDYASSKGIPFVIVLGEKEVSSRKAKLRDMRTGQEKEIHLSALNEVGRLVKE